MRVLLLGPGHDGGSIPPYLDVLAGALRNHGVDVTRHGSTCLPYDHNRQRFWSARTIVDAARQLLTGVELDAYDVIALHHGNLEIEQLLPVLWADRRRAPVVHHGHTLEPTLFSDHIPDRALATRVRAGRQRADALLAFGDYGHQRLRAHVSPTAPTVVALLPTTIPLDTPPRPGPALAAALDDLSQHGGPLATLYGFATPWKDAGTLLAALERLTTPLRVLLAGPFWDDPDQAGAALPTAATIGHARLHVVPTYLDAPQRAALVGASDLAVFSYQPHDSFQGSGAIADYLAHAVPVVATDVANMAELTGPAGDLVLSGDPTGLADALQRYATDPDHRARRRSAAARRAPRFTAHAHAAACLSLYQRSAR